MLYVLQCFMFCSPDQLNITDDDSMLDDIEDNEQSDWLNNTDPNLSCEELLLPNEKETDTTTTEGT